MTSGLRTVLAALLGVLGCLLVVVSVPAVWGKTEVLDTDRYVAAVAPLSDDPAVQTEVIDQVTAGLVKSTDSSDLPDALSSFVARAVRGRTRDFVRSDAFAELWTQTNRDLHQQALATLTRPQSGTATARDGDLVLDLTSVLDAVRRSVLATVPGLDALPDTNDLLPPIPVRVTVAHSDQVHQGRAVVHALDRWAYGVAGATVLVLALSILTARRRLRAVAWLATGVAVAGGVVLVIARTGEAAARARASSGVASDALAAILDALATPLREASWALVVGGLVVAVVAAVASVAAGRRHAAPI